MRPSRRIGRATLYKYFSDVEAMLVAWHSSPVRDPLTAALLLTPGGTVAFGVVAEPLLKVAERATMLAGG